MYLLGFELTWVCIVYKNSLSNCMMHNVIHRGITTWNKTKQLDIMRFNCDALTLFVKTLSNYHYWFLYWYLMQMILIDLLGIIFPFLICFLCYATPFSDVLTILCSEVSMVSLFSNGVNSTDLWCNIFIKPSLPLGVGMLTSTDLWCNVSISFLHHPCHWVSECLRTLSLRSCSECRVHVGQTIYR